MSFVSETPDIQNYVRASDVMVIASREESAPLVSLEAFAYEIPLVSTAVYGLAEQIEHEVNALSFPVDDIDALARQVLTLAADSEHRLRLIKGGRRTLQEKYDLKQSVEKYLELFRFAAGRPAKN